MEKQYYVYIMSNPTNTVTYTGVTNNLYRRVIEHKNKIIEGFTKKYKITKLVCYETSESAESAIWREKQIKVYKRQRKVELINSMNTGWEDLFDELMKEE